MISIKTLFSILFFVVALSAGVLAKKEEEDPAAKALHDMQLGMAGLKEAGNNPALLAQLLRDMQDPEIMAEAKRMMDDPEFQKQMKKLSETNEFKNQAKKTAEMMKDPTTAAKYEAQFEHMLKRGEDDLKKAAGNVMEEAMAAMSNPEVMAEMTKMIKDPNFQQQLASMTKDPSMKSYMEAMQDMMQDPEKKKRFEKMSETVRAAL